MLMKKTDEKTQQPQETMYIVPTVDVADIVIEQNVLDGGSGEIPGMSGEAW